MNTCEIEELRTRNSWFAGCVREEPTKVYIKAYVSLLETREYLIPSTQYPLSGKYEVFNYTNTHLIANTEEYQHILSIFDKVSYKIGNCYGNADAMTKALRKAGYKAQTYVGWAFFAGSPVHHAWTVLWVHERPSILDLSDQMLVMEKETGLTESSLRHAPREKIVDVTLKLMQLPHRERCAPVGIPSPLYYLVGAPSNGPEGIRVFNQLMKRYPDHPCMARINKQTGATATQAMLLKKMK